MSDHEGYSGGMPHGTFSGYVTGFILSVILTVIPFSAVMLDLFESSQLTLFIVLGCAIAQIMVHMVYFLHLNLKAEGGWIMSALVFTLIVLFIAIFGTIWVMINMDSNMMPGM